MGRGYHRQDVPDRWNVHSSRKLIRGQAEIFSRCFLEAEEKMREVLVRGAETLGHL